MPEDNQIILKFSDKEIVIDTTVPYTVSDTDELLAFGDTCSEALAACRKGSAMAEAEYRQWRAVATNEILSSEPKLAEWKIKARVESEPNFVQHKSTVGEWTSISARLVDILQLLHAKLSTSSHMGN